MGRLIRGDKNYPPTSDLTFNNTVSVPNGYNVQSDNPPQQQYYQNFVPFHQPSVGGFQYYAPPYPQQMYIPEQPTTSLGTWHPSGNYTLGRGSADTSQPPPRLIAVQGESENSYFHGAKPNTWWKRG